MKNIIKNFLKLNWWSIIFYIAVLILFVKKGNKHYYALVLMIFGTALLIRGISAYIETRRNLKNVVELDGNVIKLLSEKMDGSGETTFFLIEYLDLNFVKKTFKSRNGYAFSKYRLGDKVKILVFKDKNGEEVYIKSIYEIWGATILNILIGLIFCLGGVLFMKYDIPISSD